MVIRYRCQGEIWIVDAWPSWLCNICQDTYIPMSILFEHAILSEVIWGNHMQELQFVRLSTPTNTSTAFTNHPWATVNWTAFHFISEWPDIPGGQMDRYWRVGLGLLDSRTLICSECSCAWESSPKAEQSRQSGWVVQKWSRVDRAEEQSKSRAEQTEQKLQIPSFQKRTVSDNSRLLGLDIAHVITPYKAIRSSPFPSQALVSRAQCSSPLPSWVFRTCPQT